MTPDSAAANSSLDRDGAGSKSENSVVATTCQSNNGLSSYATIQQIARNPHMPLRQVLLLGFRIPRLIPRTG